MFTIKEERKISDIPERKAMIIRKSIMAILSAAGLYTLVGLPMANAGQLEVGAARVDMTTNLSELPYQAHGERPFVGVHDAIYARSAVFFDGKNKVVLMVLDTTSVPDQISGKIINTVAEKLNISPGNILLSATHNHGTLLTFLHSDEPDNVMKQELLRTQSAAIKSALAANQALVKAKISYARGEGWVNINNGESAGIKNLYDSDHHFWTSEFNPHGIANRNLDVIRVTSMDNRPLMMMVNYASHGEVMFRDATKDGGYEVTGDLPGTVSRLLEHSDKGAPVVLYTAAAEADQLPLFKARQLQGNFPYEETGAAGWALLNMLARNLASSVISTEKLLPPGQSTLTIQAKEAFLTCPGRRSQRNSKTTHVHYVDAAPVSIGIGTIRIGDIVLAGISGDVATKIGNEIKQASPVKDTVVVSMRAGSIGYVLSDDYYRYPDSHAAAGSRIKQGCADPGLSQKVTQLLN